MLYANISLELFRSDITEDTGSILTVCDSEKFSICVSVTIEKTSVLLARSRGSEGVAREAVGLITVSTYIEVPLSRLLNISTMDTPDTVSNRKDSLVSSCVDCVICIGSEIFAESVS